MNEDVHRHLDVPPPSHCPVIGTSQHSVLLQEKDSQHALSALLHSLCPSITSKQLTNYSICTHANDKIYYSHLHTNTNYTLDTLIEKTLVSHFASIHTFSAHIDYPWDLPALDFSALALFFLSLHARHEFGKVEKFMRAKNF